MLLLFCIKTYYLKEKYIMPNFWEKKGKTSKGNSKDGSSRTKKKRFKISNPFKRNNTKAADITDNNLASEQAEGTTESKNKTGIVYI